MTHADYLLRVLRLTVLSLGLLGVDILANAAPDAPTTTVVSMPDDRSVTAEPEQRPIQFKQESKHTASVEFKPFVVLGIIALLAVATAFWLKKKRPALLARLSGVGGRIKVVETRMVTTRLSLCLIEFDGKELLLAVNGDSVVQLHAGTPLPTPSDYTIHAPDSAE